MKKTISRFINTVMSRKNKQKQNKTRKLSGFIEPSDLIDRRRRGLRAAIQGLLSSPPVEQAPPTLTSWRKPLSRHQLFAHVRKWNVELLTLRNRLTWKELTKRRRLLNEQVGDHVEHRGLQVRSSLSLFVLSFEQRVGAIMSL